jgi:tripartite-type tricarboxylate transporter receptor subunit TctC
VRGRRMLNWRQTYAGLALAIAAVSALAQPYPVKPVRIIVPNAPGGPADVSARMIAPKLAEALGQQFVVENRVGAGSTLGTAAAVKSAPDGYTLLVVFDSHAKNPHLFRNLEYDTVADLAPISLLVRGPLVLVVHPGVPARSVSDFVRLARSRPGAINFASVGPGSPARLLMELLKIEARIAVTNVPYKGAGTALTDLVGGHVDAMFPTVSSANAHIKAGRLRAIAVTSEKPTPVLPGVPAMRETYPGFVAETWTGMLAPARTPTEVIARLNETVARVLDQPDTRARFAELALATVGGTPAQFELWIRAEIARWGKVIRAQGITID